MIMYNKNKKLSRNKKQRIERRIKKDYEIKTFLNKIKTQKKNRHKNIDKIKQLEID